MQKQAFIEVEKPPFTSAESHKLPFPGEGHQFSITASEIFWLHQIQASSFLVACFPGIFSGKVDKTLLFLFYTCCWDYDIALVPTDGESHRQDRDRLGRSRCVSCNSCVRLTGTLRLSHKWHKLIFLLSHWALPSCQTASLGHYRRQITLLFCL